MEAIAPASLPFALTLAGVTTTVAAGGFTPFTMTMSREDGSQQGIQLHMSPGLLGVLSTSVAPILDGIPLEIYPNTPQGSEADIAKVKVSLPARLTRIRTSPRRRRAFERRAGRRRRLCLGPPEPLTTADQIWYRGSADSNRAADRDHTAAWRRGG
jgi:hypothetical protein